MAVTRINFLDVPLDLLSEEELEESLLDLLNRAGPQYVVFLSFKDILRARRRGAFHDLVMNAALCIPTSKSIVSSARFLQLDTPTRHQPFAFILSALNTMEAHFKSLYVLGGRQKSLSIAEGNIRSTYPRIRFLGRFPGYYHRDMERNIVAAMAKANADLTILSGGVPRGLHWIYKHKAHFKSGLFVYHSDLIDIFSGQKKRVSEKTFARGHEYLRQVLRNPLKAFSIFPFLRFKLIVLFYKLFRQ